MTLALAAMLSAVALAEEQSRVYQSGNTWVQETKGTIPAGSQLHVKVAMGSVQVLGNAASGVSYTIRHVAYTSSEQEARSQFARYHISASNHAEHSTITAEWSGKAPRKFSGSFEVAAPRNLEFVEVETQGGDVNIRDIAGNVETQSGGGSARIAEIGGSVRAETGGGNVTIGKVGSTAKVATGGGNVELGDIGGEVGIDTGGGNVRLASAKGAVRIETGGGNIHAQKCNGAMKATTGGGNIEIGEVGGGAQMESGGGSIRLISASGRIEAQTAAGYLDLGRVYEGIRAETGGGGITAQFVSGGLGSDSELETPSGDIILYLASDVKMSVRAAIEVAGGHRIISDFPEIRIAKEGDDWGAKTFTAEGSLNGGGPVLKVHTTTGNIEFRRLSESAKR